MFDEENFCSLLKFTLIFQERMLNSSQILNLHIFKKITNIHFRGRGGNQSGFYRGGRGRGANHQGEHRGGNQGYRGRGGGRGGFQPGRPTANPKKEPLKFEGEYDFDKANEEFKEVLEKLQVNFVFSQPENSTWILISR